MRGRDIQPSGTKDLRGKLDLKNKTTSDGRLDSHDGNHPALRIPAAIPSSAALILQNH
jgi:hypothetical protein